MGGNVFGVVARRLTTEQHDALLEYALLRLKPFTVHRIASPPTAADKTTHGDLDISLGNWAAGAGFKYNFAVDTDEAREAILKPVDPEHWRTIGDTKGYEWSTEEVREWARSIGTVLRAKAWQNHQQGVSLAVPCDVLGDLASDAEADEFFQIDIRMVRPDRFDFAIFIMAYGVTALLLAQAVRCLSEALVIHNDHLVIKHAPFPGLRPIEVEITPSATEMLDWLGLDEERWEKGFETQQDFWKWLVALDTVAAEKTGGTESLIRRAWKVFAATRGEIPRVVIRHQPPRLVEAANFREWLRTEYGRANERIPSSSRSAVRRRDTEDAGKQFEYLVITKTVIRVDPATGMVRAESRDSKVEKLDKEVKDTTESTLIDPDHPVPLDDFAVEALESFGKTAAYQKSLLERTAEAREVHQRQERKRQNREFSLQRESPAAREAIAKQHESRLTKDMTSS